MFDRFTAGARRAVVASQEVARAGGCSTIEIRHLALGTLADPYTVALSALLGVDVSDLEQTLDVEATSTEPVGHLPFTDDTKHALEQALSESMALGQRGITGAHLFLACWAAEPTSRLAALLAGRGVSLADGRHAAAALPDVSPAAEIDAVGLLETLTGSAGIDADRRRLLSLQLVGELIRASGLGEARQLATSLLGGGDDLRIHRQLATVAELSGDMEALLSATAAAIAIEPSPGLLSSRALALAHQGRADEASALFDQAARCDEPMRSAVALETAEAALLTGDVEAAQRAVDTVILDADPAGAWLTLWHRIVTFELAALGGRPAPTASEVSMPELHNPIDHLLVCRAKVTEAHRLLLEGADRNAAKAAQRAADDARAREFGGAATDAMEVRARALARRSRRGWRDTVIQAADNAAQLGRLVQADRINALLG